MRLFYLNNENVYTMYHSVALCHSFLCNVITFAYPKLNNGFVNIC